MKKIVIRKCPICEELSDLSTMVPSTNFGPVCKKCYDKRQKSDHELTTLIDILLERYGVYPNDRANLLRYFADKFDEKYGLRTCFIMKVGENKDE